MNEAGSSSTVGVRRHLLLPSATNGQSGVRSPPILGRRRRGGWAPDNGPMWSRRVRPPPEAPPPAGPGRGPREHPHRLRVEQRDRLLGARLLRQRLSKRPFLISVAATAATAHHLRGAASDLMNLSRYDHGHIALSMHRKVVQVHGI